MRMQESTRRYVVGGLTLFVVIGLIVASVMGKKQDVAFQTDEAQYSVMLAQMEEGQYLDAVESSKALEERHLATETVNYWIALAAANSGDSEKGARHFQRALDINPHRVEEAMFMLQYAEMLMLTEKKDGARQVLERCATFAEPETYPQYQERVTQLQAQLAAQS